MTLTTTVCQAELTFAADLVGVANEAPPAATGGSVAVHLADSVHPASQSRARVLALFLDAGKVLRAIGISLAFRSRCCDGKEAS